MTELQKFIALRTPPGWTTRPLWSLFRRRKLTGYPDEELLSVYRDYGVIPKSSRDDNHNKESDDLSGYQLVKEGALVTNKMKAWQGSIAISRYRGIVSPAYYVYEPLSQEWDQFLHYLLRSEPYIALYGRISKGIRVNQWDLEHNALRNVPVMLPDLNIQKAIADFLDSETARIDQLIKKKQYQIDLLEEQFRSEIHKVVCKGLQSEFPTKDSGLRWFGHVPRHWQMKPLRHVLLFQRGHDLPSDERIAGNVPVVSSGGSSSVHDVSVAEAPGIVTGRYGTIGSFYFIEEPYWPLNTTLYSKRLFEEPRYVWYLLQEISHIFILNSSKSAVPGIDRNDLHSEYVPVPPKEEQILAVQHLEVKRTLKERLSLLVEESIDGLREFRSSLITAAVTGQIDVTTWGKEGEAARRLDKIEEAMQA